MACPLPQAPMSHLAQDGRAPLVKQRRDFIRREVLLLPGDSVLSLGGQLVIDDGAHTPLSPSTTRRFLQGSREPPDGQTATVREPDAPVGEELRANRALLGLGYRKSSWSMATPCRAWRESSVCNRPDNPTRLPAARRLAQSRACRPKVVTST